MQGLGAWWSSPPYSQCDASQARLCRFPLSGLTSSTLLPVNIGCAEEQVRILRETIERQGVQPHVVQPVAIPAVLTAPVAWPCIAAHTLCRAARSAQRAD